ncbi:hypothetical protein KC19_5G098400 [Ceratodon purpureus]|uniref:Uncharacterized protein n=1 Tax=Ceratodon purpureus TaxID=3225 RepID=A0A8T0I1Y1_CERPU|nr:hypothetical protein KC19_5G098400 [Ceratodon purpureus]
MNYLTLQSNGRHQPDWKLPEQQEEADTTIAFHFKPIASRRYPRGTELRYHQLRKQKPPLYQYSRPPYLPGTRTTIAHHIPRRPYCFHLRPLEETNIPTSRDRP